jgi:Cupin
MNETGTCPSPLVGTNDLVDVFSKNGHRTPFLTNLKPDRKNLKEYEFANLFPGRKDSGCSKNLSRMIITVCSDIPEIKKTIIMSQYEQLGLRKKAVRSLLTTVDCFHIILSVGNDCVGHLCCCFHNEHWFAVVLMAVFAESYQGHSLGSLLLVLAEELMNAMQDFHSFLRSLQFRAIPNDEKKKLWGSWKSSEVSKWVGVLLTKDKEKLWCLESRCPLALITGIFLWRFKPSFYDIEGLCKQVLSFVLGGFENRKKHFNRELAAIDVILRDVFPDSISTRDNYKATNHKLPEKSTQLKTDDPVEEHIPLKVGDPVDDDILESLISKVRTVPIDTPDYVPGLSLVDLGQAEEDLTSTTINTIEHPQVQDPGLDPSTYEDKLLEQYKGREEQCFFFNVAKALLGDAKRYIEIRQIFFLVFIIISRLSEDHPFFDGTNEAFFGEYDWIGHIKDRMPIRLLQFYLHRNEDLCDKALRKRNVKAKLQKQLEKLSAVVFGFKANLAQFQSTLNDGIPSAQKKLYGKLARSYLYSNFQGDDCDCELLGRLFAVELGIVNVVVASDEKEQNTSRVQDFDVNFVMKGWDAMSREQPLFSEDKELHGKSHLKLTFWLARVNDDHFLHFCDTNYDTRKETNREPMDHLKLLHQSKWSSRINEFLMLSHGYMQPIIIHKGTDLNSIIYDTDGKFVLTKPIHFTKDAFSLTGMEIREPFASRLSLLDNLQYIINSQDGTSSKFATVIEVHEQKEYRQKYTWNDVKEFFEAETRTDTAYNQVNCCFAHSNIKDCVISPEFVRKNDWIDRYFTERDTANPDNYDYPRVQKTVVTSTRHCFMDCHFDYGGLAAWFYVLKGQKDFILIEPTRNNIELYESCYDAKKPGNEWFCTRVARDHPDTLYRITLREGQTLVFPAGFIHAVYTPLDTIAFVGCFMYDEAASTSLYMHDNVECYEKEPNFLPKYREMFLLALEDAFDKFKSGNEVEGKVNVQQVHAIIDSAEKWYHDACNGRKKPLCILNQQKDLARKKNFTDFPSFLDAFRNLLPAGKSNANKRINCSPVDSLQQSSKKTRRLDDLTTMGVTTQCTSCVRTNNVNEQLKKEIHQLLSEAEKYKGIIRDLEEKLSNNQQQREAEERINRDLEEKLSMFNHQQQQQLHDVAHRTTVDKESNLHLPTRMETENATEAITDNNLPDSPSHAANATSIETTTTTVANQSSQSASLSPSLNVAMGGEEVNGVAIQARSVAIRQHITKFKGIPIPNAYWFLAKHQNDSIKYVDKSYIFNEPIDTHILHPGSEKLLQNSHALHEYIASLERLKSTDITSGTILKVMNVLKKEVLGKLCVSQHIMILGENFERENPNYVPYTRIQQWSYGFKTPGVQNRFISNYDGPGVKWLGIKKPEGRDDYVVFASRSFNKNITIGVYFGRCEFNHEKASEYAVATPYGFVDPQPESKNLSTLPFGMGMHYVKFTHLKESANVVLNRFLCFVTTQKIKKGQEIVAYCDSVVFLRYNTVETTPKSGGQRDKRVENTLLKDYEKDCGLIVVLPKTVRAASDSLAKFLLIEKLYNCSTEYLTHFNFSTTRLGKAITVNRFGTMMGIEKKPLTANEDGIKNRFCTKESVWTFNIQFFAWYCGTGEDREDIQSVPWLLVQKDDLLGTFAVIALRDFTIDELIGIYWGPPLKDGQTLSKYALRTDYGIVDPGYGLDEVTAERKFQGLGLHHIARSNIDSETNAHITDQFVVVATKHISSGTEIKLKVERIEEMKTKTTYQI